MQNTKHIFLYKYISSPFQTLPRTTAPHRRVLNLHEPSTIPLRVPSLHSHPSASESLRAVANTRGWMEARRCSWNSHSAKRASDRQARHALDSLRGAGEASPPVAAHPLCGLLEESGLKRCSIQVLLNLFFFLSFFSSLRPWTMWASSESSPTPGEERKLHFYIYGCFVLTFSPLSKDVK